MKKLQFLSAFCAICFLAGCKKELASSISDSQSANALLSTSGDLTISIANDSLVVGSTFPTNTIAFIMAVKISNPNGEFISGMTIDLHGSSDTVAKACRFYNSKLKQLSSTSIIQGKAYIEGLDTVNMTGNVKLYVAIDVNPNMTTGNVTPEIVSYLLVGSPTETPVGLVGNLQTIAGDPTIVTLESLFRSNDQYQSAEMFPVIKASAESDSRFFFKALTVTISTEKLTNEVIDSIGLYDRKQKIANGVIGTDNKVHFYVDTLLEIKKLIVRWSTKTHFEYDYYVSVYPGDLIFLDKNGKVAQTVGNINSPTFHPW